MKIETTPEMVEGVYATTRKNLDVVRKRLGKPLTLAEKVLYGHLHDAAGQDLARGKAILGLHPDRVAMQDATAQMAILQFAQAGLPETAVPTTVHCDHLIRARAGAAEDMKTALGENKEVYDFLASASAKYGLGFWKPGAGIIHQVVLENYAFPGGLIIGTDSHTPNGGGLGMIAVGVGGADAVDAMAGLPWEVKNPKLIGVRLVGSFNPSLWSSAKDVILWLCGKLTVKGGTNHVVEFFGPGAKSLSATGKGTICNMGAEHGATTSIFPFDDSMARYLKATGRAELVALAEKNRDLLEADPEALAAPEKHFDQVIELNLTGLQPHVNGPHTPDRVRPIGDLAAEVKKEGWPEKLKATLIGSCTNSSYEDLARVMFLARQAKQAGLKAAVPLLISPGSNLIYETMKKEGWVGELEAIGATVLANACGPCIGQWKRDDIKKGETNAILNSFNRNFPGRNDGNAETLSFISSPDIVLALSLAGRLTFDPLKDSLPTPDGGSLKLLAPPATIEDVPKRGFGDAGGGYVAPPRNRTQIKVIVDPKSERLQLLDPFAPWDGKDFVECPLLLKAKGKCTTDHISPAGPWLKFRGHLDHISDNMFTGAINASGGAPGTTVNLLTGGKGKPVPEVARAYKAKGLRWIVVGDENYGEGSSREHAAMSPRFLGAAAIIVRSFARIHETNLKKQGVLPLTFAGPADYDKVKEDDRLSLTGLRELAPGKPVKGVLKHADGKSEELSLNHTLTAEQIEWFKAGSALNLLKKKS